MQAFLPAAALCVAVFDLALTRGAGLASLALLYAAAKIQADSAAERFLREGLVWPESRNADPVPFPPPEPEPPPRPGARPQARRELKVIPLAEARRRAQRPASPAAAQFRAPNFSGRPHEVLGVPENAVTKVIQKAFRHWIKRYHPDHARQPGETRSANERAIRLNAAKDQLLEKRRQKPKAA